MIKIRPDTILNLKNIASWVSDFTNERNRRKMLYDIYTNRGDMFKLPYAKKLVLTASSATVGNGVDLLEPKELSEKQKALFDKINELFDKRAMKNEDKAIVIEGGATSTAYELAYMSNDEVPEPRVAKISSADAFVIFDNTVDMNSLYGVWLEYGNRNNNSKLTQYVVANVADSERVYTVEFEVERLKNVVEEYDLTLLEEGQQGNVFVRYHNMGRVPLTKYWNNDEEQSDFEQIIPLLKDRTLLHNLTLADTEKIVKNILALINAQLSGDSKEEKSRTLNSMAEIPVLELESGPNKAVDAKFLSKSENYGMIDVFGKDIDSKIYDLTMIPDLTSDQFSGNTTGVALELKLLPFKELISLKESFLIKLYKRRLKLYAHALTQPVIIGDSVVQSSEYEIFDTDNIEVIVHRNWTQNIVEIADIILKLSTTGLYSSKYLTNLMPSADYEEEIEQKKIEKVDNNNNIITQADPNNTSLEELVSLFRPKGEEIVE